jgi:hypothetical protein
MGSLSPDHSIRHRGLAAFPPCSFCIDFDTTRRAGSARHSVIGGAALWLGNLIHGGGSHSKLLPMPEVQTALLPVRFLDETNHAAWFEDYSESHPHKALQIKSPREFIRNYQPAACPVG